MVLVQPALSVVGAGDLTGILHILRVPVCTTTIISCCIIIQTTQVVLEYWLLDEGICECVCVVVPLEPPPVSSPLPPATPVTTPSHSAQKEFGSLSRAAYWNILIHLVISDFSCRLCVIIACRCHSVCSVAFCVTLVTNCTVQFMYCLW